jgi:pyridoxamine 5'-phosphate oxidase-like protein
MIRDSKEIRGDGLRPADAPPRCRIPKRRSPLRKGSEDVNRTPIGSNRAATGSLVQAATRRQMIIWSAIALGGLAIAPAGGVASAFAESNPAAGKADVRLSQRDADALSKASVLYIATVRKDGNQSTAAPVWFTISPDHRVLIQTQPTTWKAKRIRRGSPVLVWIGKPKGPAFIAKAEITSDPAVSGQIVADYPKRYLMARLGMHTPTQEMFDKGQIIPITITPVRDLPEGFASGPGTPAPKIESAQ